MSRLRVRIELNRGGVGVPLDKLASVVQQSQSFFRMLGDDVHIDQRQGDWLGFDFDHESLNFTAEFVGAVTPEQVAAFHSAFDGTTALRRATIAQFARIADAIDEDEVIGFGLYLNPGDDPAEWRCLSRRDALRITEEIRVLLGAGETAPESHLPTGAEVSTDARYLFGRRDRAVDAAKLTGAVREVEASLSKRISRLEGEVADHSSHIQDLRSRSVEAEQSMGRLLSAVEGFCEQAATRLETVTVPALAAGAAVGGAPVEAISKVEGLSKPEALSNMGEPLRAETPTRAEAPPIAEAPAASQAAEVPPPIEFPATTLDTPVGWRSPIGILVGVGIVMIILGVVFWANRSSSAPGNQVTAAAEPVNSAAPSSASAPSIPAVSTPAPSAPVAASPQRSLAPPLIPEPPAPTNPKASAPPVLGATRIELEATEPSWISIRGGDGTPQLARLIEPGNIQTVDVREPAVLRAGNAGGLTIRAHGKSIGPLGPHGAVRDVELKDGEIKLVPIK